MSKVLDLDTFGEIMDKFIKDNEIKILITLPQGSIDAVVDDNVGAGSVLQFYIVLNDQKERESFFLLDEEEQNRNIFRVRSFGFDHQKFIEFYRKLRWNVPGRVRIIGTKNQDVWNLRKPNMEICIIAGMIACYVIPKLLEVMKLF